MREVSTLVFVGLAIALTAGGAHAQVDRYGGSAERRPTRVATANAAPWQTRAPSGEAGRTLSWPGKTAGAPAEAAPQAHAPAPTPASAEPQSYAPARVAAPLRASQPALAPQAPAAIRWARVT